MKPSESLPSLVSTSLSRRICSALSGRALALCAFLLTFALASEPASAQLINGGSVAGSISTAGEQDSYTFTANAGEGFQLRLADTGATALIPQLSLYSPGGTLLVLNWGVDVAAIDNAAPTTGTYTVVAEDRNGTATGAYQLYFVRMPGANEGGVLPNGGSITSSLGLGDLDSYTFAASAGEGFQLRVADIATTALVPQMWLYGPTGTLLVSNWGVNVAAIDNAAPTTGTYTVVVGDRNATGTGAYDLYFVRMPGANEGGALVNGGVINATIDLGDLDSYTFSANAGEGFQLRMADVATTALVPQMWLYGPSGTLLVSNWGVDVAAIINTAPTSGTYTVVAGDRNATGTGDYDLYFTMRPGANEGGALINGGVITDTIDLGDLDSYTFSMSAGEGYQLRMADVAATALVPQMWVYDPSGALLISNWGVDVAAITTAAATTGTYTLVVGDRNNTGTGVYDLYFAGMPGANEGGLLPNGGLVTGNVDLGDLDSYTFPANVGEGFQLRAADVNTTALVPQMWVYDPSGALVISTWGVDVAAITTSAASAGTYTLVVGDRNATGTGVYDLYFARMPGANEGGALVNGTTISGTIDLGDLDSFTFATFAGDDLDLQVFDSTTTLVPQIWLYNPSGVLLVSNWGLNLATISIVAPTTGTYTLIVADRNATGTGDYGLFTSRGLDTYCTAGTSANGCTADISATGDPSAGDANGFVVSAATAEGNKDGLFFFGTNGRQASPWGNGTSFQCVIPPVTRAPLVSSGGTSGNCDGTFMLDFNALITAKPSKAPPTGATVQIQCWYRDPFNTSNQSTSLSDALEFTLRP